MPTGTSRARASWQGGLADGQGTVSTSSGVLTSSEVSWKARAERNAETPQTSPEELIGAAIAACFSMALANDLAQGGHAPEKLDVSSTTHFEVGAGGAKISDIHLDVKGKVPGMDQPSFQQAVDGAARNCPVSQALKGNVQITANAQLQS